MTSQDIPLLSMNGNDVEDRATAAVLAEANANAGPHFRQPLAAPSALAEISALL